MPMRPVALNPRPGILLAVLGGLVGTLLISALLFLAPALGLPYIDFPLLVGGVFTDSPAIAFWLGFALFFLIGAFVFGPVFSVLWSILPGRGVGHIGALLKGVVWGLVLWIASGLGIPVLFALNQLADTGYVQNPGLFAHEAGWAGVLAVLGGHLAYGVALGLVAALGQGLHPLDAIGWPSHHKALTPPDPALIGADELPDSPTVGSR